MLRKNPQHHRTSQNQPATQPHPLQRRLPTTSTPSQSHRYNLLDMRRHTTTQRSLASRPRKPRRPKLTTTTSTPLMQHTPQQPIKNQKPRTMTHTHAHTKIGGCPQNGEHTRMNTPTDGHSWLSLATKGEYPGEIVRNLQVAISASWQTQQRFMECV